MMVVGTKEWRADETLNALVMSCFIGLELGFFLVALVLAKGASMASLPQGADLGGKVY